MGREMQQIREYHNLDSKVPQGFQKMNSGSSSSDLSSDEDDDGQYSQGNRVDESDTTSLSQSMQSDKREMPFQHPKYAQVQRK